MSIPVALDELAKALRDYDGAYLLTAADQGGPHVVAVDVGLRDTVLEIASAGTRTRTNAATHPSVTLLWPPRQRDGYSLIVDGEVEVAGDGLQVTPHRAVLHRPAPRPAAAGAPADDAGCVSDCVELPLTATSR